MQKSYFLPVLILLAGIPGCTHQPVQPTRPPVQNQAQKNKLTLEKVVKLADASMLELRVLDSLQRIAKEHVEKKRLLDLPGMIRDLPRRLPEFSTENDFRLHTLDHALDACRLLTSPANASLSQIHTPVEKKKIVLEQSIRWAKLDYVRILQNNGIRSASLDSLKKDIELELLISYGMSQQILNDFDFNSLPQPHPFEIPAAPEYVREMISFYKDAPDCALRFADIIFRLPAELLQRKESNSEEAFQLALAVGTAIKLDIDRQYLSEAFRKFESLVRKKQAAKIVNPGMTAELEQARLAWRIAFFRTIHDTNPYPAKISKKEISFLRDLLALQSK